MDRKRLWAGAAVPPKRKNDFECLGIGLGDGNGLPWHTGTIDLECLLVRKGCRVTGNQLIGGIEMFDGTSLFIDHFEGAAIEAVNNGIADQHLDIAADGVTDGIRPGPGGSDYTVSTKI